MEKKFFIYMRQSKKDNSQHTFDVQRIGIKQFAQIHGIVPDFTKNVYAFEEQIPAYGDKERPLFEHIISELTKDCKEKDINKRKYEGIIFFNVSRLARNPVDFTRIEELMKEGYKMLSATENIIDSPAWMYFFRMIQVESIHYSDRQSSKSLNYYLHTLAYNPYKYMGWKEVAFWYIRKGNDIWIHPIESKIVKKIFELRMQGYLHKTIALEIRKEFEDALKEFNRNARILETHKKWEKEKKDNATRTQSKNYNIENSDPEEESPLENIEIISEPEFIDDSTSITPSATKVSDILNNNGMIKFNGKRQLEFRIKFNEDAKMLNGLYESNNNLWWKILTEWGRLIKWANIIEVEAPNFEIVKKEAYEWFSSIRHKRLLNKALRNPKDYSQIYRDIVECACGSHMVAKKEWDRRYYRCSAFINDWGCHRSGRIDEGNISKFIQSEILRHLVMKEENPEFESILEALKKKQIEHFNGKIRTEAGHLSAFESRIKGIEDIEMREKYLLKITEKAQEVELLRAKRDELVWINRDIFRSFFSYIDSFLELDIFWKSVFAPLLIEKIVLDEIQSPDFIYDNPQNRKSVQYQKIATEIQLRPYLHELYLLNKYHGWLK